MLRGIHFGFAVLVVITGTHSQSYAQSYNPFADRAGKLVEAVGSISVLRDGNPWALNVGDSVQVRQTIITGPDGYGKFQVSDGSTFEVFPNSRGVFRVNPSSPKDLLDLYLGKVKVHIEKMMGGRPNPNNVNTPTAIISVRGTTFFVEATEDTTQVGVEEGVVDVTHVVFHSSVTLKDGDTVIVYKNQSLAKASKDASGFVNAAINKLAEIAQQIGPRIGRGGTSGTGVPTAGNGGGRPADKGGKTPTEAPGTTAPAPPPPPLPAPPPPPPPPK